MRLGYFMKVADLIHGAAHNEKLDEAAEWAALLVETRKTGKLAGTARVVARRKMKRAA